MAGEPNVGDFNDPFRRLVTATGDRRRLRLDPLPQPQARTSAIPGDELDAGEFEDSKPWTMRTRTRWREVRRFSCING
jgi:hypothetical protein